MKYRKQLRGEWSGFMFFEPTLDHTIIHMKIKCFNKSCDNVIDFSYSEDLSPRMEGECPKCRTGYFRKLHGLNESEIISRTEERVYR